MLYFAYGSNMCEREMASTCPHAIKRYNAHLPGYRLDFTHYSKKKTRECGVADIIEDHDSDVWGIVYDINDQEVTELHKREGFKEGRERGENSYEPLDINVEIDGDTNRILRVIAFIVVNKKQYRPSNAYKALLLCGARRWQLPDEYIRRLEAIEVDL